MTKGLLIAYCTRFDLGGHVALISFFVATDINVLKGEQNQINNNIVVINMSTCLLFAAQVNHAKVPEKCGLFS